MASNFLVSIRHATAADLAAIRAIEQSAPTAAHWSLEQYRTALFAPERLALVLEENSQILGFLVARVIEDEWELENIVVEASTLCGGVGSLLMDELIHLARSRSAKAIFLEVRESNLPARRLYEKHGFVECGRRANYYTDPQEDAIVYRLILS